MATEVYGIYSAPITYEHCNAFLQILWNYAKGRDHVLHLAISSDGGDMTAGIMVFNALRSLPITLKTYNLGSVNSVANAMFLAGETRCAAPSSSFGYHSAGFYTQPNIRIDAKLVSEWASKLKTDNERLAAILLDVSRQHQWHRFELVM